MNWKVIADGGRTYSVGGLYRLGATVGQLDAAVSNGGSYRLTSGFWTMSTGPLLAVDGPAQTPLRFRLLPGAPNPFGAQTSLAFELPLSRHVSLGVYDLNGALLRTLLDENREAGQYQLTWDGTDSGAHRMAPGIYWIRMDTGDAHRTTKLVLLR